MFKTTELNVVLKEYLSLAQVACSPMHNKGSDYQATQITPCPIVAAQSDPIKFPGSCETRSLCCSSVIFKSAQLATGQFSVGSNL